METHAGGHVDIEIGVVHTVQPPQRRHVMEDDVLTVNHQIERDHAERDRRPGRQRQQIEQPPAALGRDQRDADGSGRHEKSHRYNIDGQDAEIAGPARPPTGRQVAARGDTIPTAP